VWWVETIGWQIYSGKKGNHYFQLITHSTFVYESSPELLGGVSIKVSFWNILTSNIIFHWEAGLNWEVYSHLFGRLNWRWQWSLDIRLDSKWIIITWRETQALFCPAGLPRSRSGKNVVKFLSMASLSLRAISKRRLCSVRWWSGPRGSVVVEALWYKQKMHGFETQWGEWFSIYLIRQATLGLGIY
jgi:hypothetical protein